MLKVIDCNSLDDLMDKVMPTSIVDKYSEIHGGKHL
jgi:hypothetical protein